MIREYWIRIYSYMAYIIHLTEGVTIPNWNTRNALASNRNLHGYAINLNQYDSHIQRGTQERD